MYNSPPVPYVYECTFTIRGLGINQLPPLSLRAYCEIIGDIVFRSTNEIERKSCPEPTLYFNFGSEFQRLSLDSRVEKSSVAIRRCSGYNSPCQQNLWKFDILYMSKHFQKGFPVVLFSQIWLQLMTDSCMEAVQTSPLLIQKCTLIFEKKNSL